MGIVKVCKLFWWAFYSRRGTEVNSPAYHYDEFITILVCCESFLHNDYNYERESLFDYLAKSYILRDGSLITCGEGVEDILIYLMEFSSPPSQIYVNILIPTPESQNKLLSPSPEMLFIFQPPSL